MEIALLVVTAIASFVLGAIWSVWMIAKGEARERAAYEERKAAYMKQVYEAICSKYNIPTNTFRGVDVPDDLPEDL